MFKRSRIYLDYASITPTDSRVNRLFKKISSKVFANPGSIHSDGVLAKKTLIEARKICAGVLGAENDEIIFTSGGTESNNLAIIGLYNSLIQSGKKANELHAITSVIEHSSVLESFRYLESLGVKVEYINVDRQGIVDFEKIKKSLRSETFLISIMMMNNEIGVIEPIKEIAKLVRKHNEMNKSDEADSIKTVFHTDASQALLIQKVKMPELGVDLITLDSNKTYGPHGVGLLYKNKKVNLLPINFGGGQEGGLRSGTENVATIRVFAESIRIADREREVFANKITELRNHFIDGMKNLSKEVNSEITVNSPEQETDSFIVNVAFEGLDAEYLTLYLDANGISVSTKSSCLRDADESYVLKAIGLDKKKMNSSVRFSLGKYTRKSDLDKTLNIIRKCYNIKHGPSK